MYIKLNVNVLYQPFDAQAIDTPSNAQHGSKKTRIDFLLSMHGSAFFFLFHLLKLFYLSI